MLINKTRERTVSHSGPSKRKAKPEYTFRFLQRLPLLLAAVVLVQFPAFCGVKTKLDDERWFEIGARVQGWYQSVSEEDALHLNDFMVRRAYFYMQGQVAPKLTFFTHIAGDRLGQEGLDSPGSGLGTGVSLRDGWITYAPFEELKFQVGRMYIPFARSYGTESTFALLTLDLPFMQGGVRAKTFYPSNVGRNDGLTIWGNLAKGVVQYRFGVFDGQQGTQSTQRSTRTAVRIAINPLESEGQWFNKGNYLGTKKILSFGVGYDRQADLQWASNRPIADYSAWTTDVFFDHPVKSSAVNLEWSYTGMKNSQELGDAKTWYLQGGWLLPAFGKAVRLQPYGKYEAVYRNAAADTECAGGGVNLLFKQHDVKLTFEFNKVLPESGSTEKSKSIFTVQMQVGI